MGCGTSQLPSHGSNPTGQVNTHDQRAQAALHPGASAVVRATAAAVADRASAIAKDPNSADGDLQACEAKLALLGSLVSGEAEDLDADTADEEIGSALDMLQGLLQLTQPADDAELDLQGLRLPSRNAAETALARHSWLGKAAMGLTSHAISALPFGAPVAAVLDGLYGSAEQAAENSLNCARLLRLVKECDSQMKKLAGAKDKKLPADARRHVRRLGVLLVRSGHTINRYSGRHFVVRFVMSGSDMTAFQKLEADVRGSMQALSLVVAMEVMTGGSYVDESKQLRAAVCKAAGLPEGPEHANKALLQLRKEQPERLEELLRSVGGFGEQVVGQALHALKERLGKLEAEVGKVKAEVGEVKAEVGGVKSRLEQIEDKLAAQAIRGPPCMPAWLSQWWRDAIGRLKLTVADSDFVQALINWFAKQGLDDVLAEYDAELASEGLLAQLKAKSDHPFLSHIVLPLLDSDHDKMVTRSELLQLERLSHEFALTKSLTEPPDSMPTMLDALYIGFDRDSLAKAKQLQESVRGALDTISAALQVRDMIHTYGIASLLDEYHRGSRQWMYDKVDAWLDVALLHTNGAGEASRLFLLLADAGMGKSVFSAVMNTKLMVRANRNATLVMVRHFFKVGQPRAQGKAALLCLAQQLSEQLPGFADLLLPVVEKHGNGSAQSMLEVFDSFLLGPLKAMDKAMAPGSQRHSVLIVLDALDESDDGGRGWQPVTNMIAKEFRSLPLWVKVLLTGRPQVEPAFTAWDPVWIKPEGEENKRDLRELLRWRLADKGCVPVQDVDDAADLLLRKSGGQFIYSKYVFEELADQATWTLAEMKSCLPDGLQGMFRHVMDTLCDALKEEAPDMLELLLQRLLPVLAAVREPLTVDELTWVVAGDMQQGRSETGREQVGKQVSRLVGLLAPLFPTRMVGSGGESRVIPYHKSVLDWLDPASSDRGGGGEQHEAASMATSSPRHAYAMDVAVGHRLLGQAAGQLVLMTADHALAASAKQRSCELHQLCAEEMPVLPLLGGRYAVRHAVAHLCMAAAAAGATTSTDAVVDLLRKLVLHPGFWQQVFGTGVGPDVTRDLIMHGPGVPQGPGRSLINDVVKWLSSNFASLALYPRAALQFAIDAPRATLVAQASSASSHRPLARLLTKEDNWPPLVATFLGHTDGVTSVAINPNGKIIVSASRDGTVRVWDALTGQQKSVLEGHTEGVNSVAISPDGKTIVSGSWDNIVCVWDALTGQQKSLLKGHTGNVTSVAISQDGKTVVSGSADKTVRMWDALTGQQKSVLEGHTDYVCSVAVSPDGKTIVSGSWDCIVCVWDALTGQQKSVLEGHAESVNSVAISPDGKTIVSGSADKTVRMWDALTGQQKSVLEGHTESVNSVAISPDGKTIVSGSADKTVRLWNALTGQQKSMLEGHTGCVCSVAISPDGKTIVSGSKDKTVRVWDAWTGQRKSVLEGHADYVCSVAISPDGKTIVSGAGSEENTVSVWDALTGQQKSVLEGHTREVTSVAISPDGKTIVSGSKDNIVCVWDALTGQQKSVLEGHTRGVTCVAISPDGKIIVSGSWDNTVRMWDALTGQRKSVLRGHTRDVNSVAISPEGKTIVSGSNDKTVRVWDALTGQQKSVLEGHNDWVTSVAISPDGKTIVSGSKDNTVRVWAMEDGRQLEVLMGQEADAKEQEVDTWTWTSSGQTMVLSSKDGNGQVVQLHLSSTRALVATVYVSAPFMLNTGTLKMGVNRFAAFTRDNKFLCYELALPT